MALINFPPAADDTDTGISPCCTPDPIAFQSMFDYGLALLLLKVGGADFTDCDTVVAGWREQSRDMDSAHTAVAELDLLIDLLAANGITVTADQLLAGGACIRSNIPLQGLQALQFYLWNQIVNELTP